MGIKFKGSEHWDIIVVKTKATITKEYISTAVKKHMEFKSSQDNSVISDINIMDIKTIFADGLYITVINVIYSNE